MDNIMEFRHVQLNPRSANKKYEVLCYALLMNAAEHGTPEEELRWATAFQSIQAQQKKVDIDDCVNLPGFDKELCQYLKRRVIDIRLFTFYKRQLARDLNEGVEPVPLDEDDNDPDAANSLGLVSSIMVANVKIFKRNFGPYFNFKFVIPWSRNGVPLQANFKMPNPDYPITPN